MSFYCIKMFILLFGLSKYSENFNFLVRHLVLKKNHWYDIIENNTWKNLHHTPYMSETPI